MHPSVNNYANSDLIALCKNPTYTGTKERLNESITVITAFNDSINGKGFVAWIKRVFYAMFKCFIPERVRSAKETIKTDNSFARSFVVAGTVLRLVGKSKTHKDSGKVILAVGNLLVKMDDVFSKSAYESILIDPLFKLFLNKVRFDIDTSICVPPNSTKEQDAEIEQMFFLDGVLEAKLKTENKIDTGQFTEVCTMLRSARLIFDINSNK